MNTKFGKRIVLLTSFLVTFFVVSNAMPAMASSTDYEYDIYNGKAWITGFGGKDTVISIPSSIDGYPVVGIGYYAFAFSNITSITIPGSVTTIKEFAFYKSMNLRNVTIPNSVTSIGRNAFLESGLKSIMIPNSVTNIGDHAFALCNSLTSIDVASGNPTYKSQNGVLFNKSMTMLVAYPCGKKDSSYVIPVGVKKIGYDDDDDVNSIFYYCSNLTSVSIPDSVTHIYSAFSMCDNLTTVKVPRSVTFIDANAFFDCKKLTIQCYAGSYAHAYAKKYDIPYKVISDTALSIKSITVNKKTVRTGEIITWKTNAEGGKGTKQYQYLLYKDGTKIKTRKYSASNTYSFTPNEAGTYLVKAYVKDSTGSVKKDSANVIVNAPLAITIVKADKTSARVGTAVTWMANATGGSGKKTYSFKLYKDGLQISTRKYTKANTYAYTPGEVGKYNVQVYVKDNTGTVSKSSGDVSVISLPSLKVLNSGKEDLTWRTISTDKRKKNMTWTVASNISWKASVSASWITLYKSSAPDGTTKVKLSISENTGKDERNAAVKFTAGGVDFEVRLKQSCVLSFDKPIHKEAYFRTDTEDGCHHDIMIPEGTALYAICDGTITYIQRYYIKDNKKILISYGNYIKLTSDDKKYVAIYAHLSKFLNCEVKIPKNQTERITWTDARVQSSKDEIILLSSRKVDAGDLIGYSGTTGKSSGPHLHFQLAIDEKRVDPIKYIGISTK